MLAISFSTSRPSVSGQGRSGDDMIASVVRNALTSIHQ